MMTYIKKTLFGLLIISCCSCASKAQDSKVDPDQQRLLETYYYINKLYVDTINKKDFVTESIKAMLENLDPHSTYITTEEVQEAEEPLQGEFDGIGITFNMLTDTIFVIEVIKGGPSEKIGIRPGDKIIKVNDSIVAGMKIKNTDIVKKLRGPKGTTVNVEVMRKGYDKLLPFSIVRGKIPIYSLDAAYMVNDSVGYIQLSRFGATTHKEFKEAYADLKKQGMKDLILDLQSNGGGYLNAAIDIANEFLEKGDGIVYAEGTAFPKIKEKAKGNGIAKEGKVIVLINDFSASASEIVSGALQDNDRGLIVGRRSFGKGLVQRPLILSDGSMIRLTVARYYTPSGRSIQKPYTPGKGEEYELSLLDRSKSGEYFDPDKIVFADSLEVFTLKNNRPIFGGGGIMPDDYVTVDTLKYSPYFNKLFYAGILHKATLNEFDVNGDKLKKKYPTAESFYANYEVPQSLINKMVKMGEEEGIKEDADGLNKNINLLKGLTKGYLARDLYDASVSARILNDNNEIFNEGLKIISDDARYTKLLKEGRIYKKVSTENKKTTKENN